MSDTETLTRSAPVETPPPRRRSVGKLAWTMACVLAAIAAFFSVIWLRT